MSDQDSIVTRDGDTFMFLHHATGTSTESSLVALATTTLAFHEVLQKVAEGLSYLESVLHDSADARKPLPFATINGLAAMSWGLSQKVLSELEERYEDVCILEAVRDGTVIDKPSRRALSAA